MSMGGPSLKSSSWLSLVGQTSKDGSKPESTAAGSGLEAAIQDLAAIEAILQAGVESQEHLPSELSRRLVGAGGKRIRPFLMGLCFRSLSQQPGLTPRATVAQMHQLAAVGELVHTATLFHDDVLDYSPTRRDMAAAHMTHGNKNAILVGDFVYAEAFFILMKHGLLEPSKKLAQTIKTIVEGELRQHQIAQDRDLSFLNYERIARAKTATLFAWCTETGAWAAGSAHYEQARLFGEALGYAFQMADDIIDTFEVNPTDASELDLRQWIDGAAPLPLVLLAERADPEVQNLWKSAVQTQDLAQRREIVARLQQLARRKDIIEECLQRVDRELVAAVGNLVTIGALGGMDWALTAIWERGLEGARLSGCYSQAESDERPSFRRLAEGERA